AEGPQPGAAHAASVRDRGARGPSRAPREGLRGRARARARAARRLDLREARRRAAPPRAARSEARVKRQQPAIRIAGCCLRLRRTSYRAAAVFLALSALAVFAAALRASDVCAPNRFVKRSTRPSVSISFCRPVKKGWQLLQISRCSSCLVERVFQVSPQAQRASMS